MQAEKSYIAIDLKSFYASVECRERGLNPLTTHLVVADKSRTSKTICLAVTPSLKALGLSGRSRLFEVEQKVRNINWDRKKCANISNFQGSSCFADTLQTNPKLAVDYIVAPPRMAFYIAYSSRIYQIYLRYIAPEDMHVYSIDEVFIDATAYLKTYHMTAEALARKLIAEVYAETGITATAGIGSNLYLCKIAMDIVAKHMEPDAYGVRIATLDELEYRKMLWNHKPLTDFWRVGKGITKKLQTYGIETMGDIARCSIGQETDFFNEDFLYKLFGVNAELLIDHAWGYEPCTLADIKQYKPTTNSLSSGQVLQNPYSIPKARLVVQEMADLLSLDLVDKRLQTDSMVLQIGYDIENIQKKHYKGPTVKDPYGRILPKPAHGTVRFGTYTSSTELILPKVLDLFDEITNESLTVRRITISAEHVLSEDDVKQDSSPKQLSLFDCPTKETTASSQETAHLNKERQKQEAVLSIQKRYGKNAILKGASLQEGATARDRNQQIGGHKA